MKTKMIKSNVVRKCASVLIACLLWGGTDSVALNFVPLSVGLFSPVSTSLGHGKSPLQSPQISQENNKLNFQSPHPDYTLTLLDETGEEVYAIFVSADTASIVLPATLSGEYELLLMPSGTSYYFYGDITL